MGEYGAILGTIIWCSSPILVAFSFSLGLAFGVFVFGCFVFWAGFKLEKPLGLSYFDV
jgi:hypothetical protein